MRPARRVRRALPLPNSVRASATRRKSATVVCSSRGGSGSVAGTRRGTPLEGTRTSITEYGGPSPSPGNHPRVPEEQRQTRSGPSERGPAGSPEDGRDGNPAERVSRSGGPEAPPTRDGMGSAQVGRSEEHTSELQSRQYLVCRLLLEKKKI